MSYIAERRQEEKDRRRIEIVEAAEDLYRELGWDAVTMDSVAKRARLSRALVYVYFKDKRDLHFAIAHARDGNAARALRGGERTRRSWGWRRSKRSVAPTWPTGRNFRTTSMPARVSSCMRRTAPKRAEQERMCIEAGQQGA